jgi:hypothetical protein
VAVELGAGAEAASIPAKTADKTIGRASLITRQLQASTSAPGGSEWDKLQLVQFSSRTS